MLGEIDYHEIGFKAGLEIHQQLDTKKLFCNCPSFLRKDEPDYIVNRKLHVVAGESGEIDVAVKHEAEKDREFFYQGYDTTCLIELDEEPPKEINKEALETALHIALLLHCKIFPITQIMRKTVIDGSNTSGFQRTVFIAEDGFVETNEGRVGIDAIYLEEDAARIIKRENGKTIFRLDRLGIPLVEIKTAPEIRTPPQAKETALKIGEILRSCKVKRGIGTIRQDVNMSIEKGERIEIKGFQDIRHIEKTIENEIERQVELVKNSKSIGEVRKALPDCSTNFLRPLPGKERMYPETDLPLLKISKRFIDSAKKTLPKFRDDIEKEMKSRGLNKEMIKLVLEGYLDDFEYLLKIYPQDPQLVAKMLTVWRSELATKSKKNISQINSVINMDELETLLEEIKKGNIDKNQIKSIFSDLMKDILLKDIIAKKTENIEEEILKIIKSNPGLSQNAYIGIAMKKFNGSISGKEVSEIVKKCVK